MTFKPNGYGKLFKFLIPLFFILSGSPQAKSSSIFGTELPTQSLEYALKQDFQHYKNVTEEIQSRFGKDALFVGIGRSPTPIIAMMLAISESSTAFNLPLTGLKSMTSALEAQNTTENLSRVSEEQMRVRFTQIMDSFVGSLDSTSRKKLIFMDYADTGSSLLNFQREITLWNSKRPVRNQFEFEILAFVHPIQPHIKRKLEETGITCIVTNWKVGSNFDKRVYREMAEYQSEPLDSRWFDMPVRLTLEKKQSAFMEYFNSTWSDSEYHQQEWAMKRKALEMKRYEDLVSFDLLVQSYRNKIQDQANPIKSKSIFVRWLYRLKELRGKIALKNSAVRSCQSLF